MAFDYFLLAGLLLFFVVGLFARFTDVFEKDKRYTRFTLFSGIAYGFGGGILAAVSPAFAAVVFGIVIGVVIAGKVDSRQHHAAVGVLLLTALLLKTAPLFLPLAILCFASFLDEDLHEIVCAQKKKRRGVCSLLEFALGSRVLLEAASFVLSLCTGNWLFFAGVVAFDAGCYFAPALGGWFKAR
ncbi:MAG: hypothetical protein QW343_02430 [Candidatus Norongarragalinales archaeon]